MRDVSVASHQIDSFNHMVNFGIQKVFEDFPPIVIPLKDDKRYVVEFGQVYIENPCIVEEDRKVKNITPKEARDRDLFYEGSVLVDIIERTITDTEVLEENLHTRYPIAKVPIMIGSVKCNLYGKTQEEWINAGECEKDPGGYFIIKGKERVLICQERINYNTIFVFNNKENYSAEIRSMSEETGHSVLTKAEISDDGKTITFSLPYVREEVNAGTVFRAFGVDTVEDLQKYISPREDMLPYIRRIQRDGRELPTRSECLEYIGERSLHAIPKDRREKYAEQVLENEIFPHLGISDRKEKIVLLGSMIDKLIRTHMGLRSEDDRDNISLKRVETAGVLILDLFRMLAKRMVDNLKMYLTKRQDVSTSINRISSITTGIHHAFSTGNWGIQKNNYVRPGVSQILSRLSYMAFTSHLRRVVIPIGKEGKSTKLRQLHPTHFGMICPAETPEGQSVGIVKNLAVFARISMKTNPRMVRGNIEIMHNYSPFDALLQNPEWTRVIHNGVVIGCTESPVEFIREFRELRIKGMFSVETSASYNRYENDILVYSDEGRFLRPFLTIDESGTVLNIEKFRNRVEKKGEELRWEELLKHGCVVYLDSLEIENSVIATSKEDVAEGGFDVCELHPTCVLSNTALTIPFPDHSQAPRNCYSSSMTKQALGTYSMAHDKRFDTMAHQMHYPQKPMVSTEFVEHGGLGSMPYGVNAIVAVSTYGGYNQEDSIMINKAAVDRGMFVTTAYRTHVLEEKRKTSKTYETIEVPPLDVRTKNRSNNYNKLDEDGIVSEGTHVFKNDVIIGRTCTKLNKDEKEEVSDCSLVLKAGEDGVVDKVLISYNSEGYKIVKIRIRTLKIPEIGDKFCLTDDHEVLTNNRGWVSIADVRLRDEVAQLNRDTGKMEYVHPTDSMRFDYDGDMYSVHNENVSLFATMDHKMWFKANNQPYTRVCAKDIIGVDGMFMNEKYQDVSNMGQKVEYFKGQVYCISVPSEVFLVRRNGKCVFTGNCSRHGQKGTCGLIVNPEDMPFTSSGMVPDVIINPHAFPTRMTINYLLEMLLGKVGSLTGKRQDSTAFTPESDDPVDGITKSLGTLGFNSMGNETLYNGMTGEPLNATIFTGVCYYQRLKHLVSDKMHARATGNVTMLTRQPLEGRSRDGGLRCGEMERDCLIAHGVSAFMKERLFTMSDPYKMNVCNQCGCVISEKDSCRICKTTNISEVAIPFACKVLLQELNAMGIKTSIETADK